MSLSSELFCAFITSIIQNDMTTFMSLVESASYSQLVTVLPVASELARYEIATYMVLRMAMMNPHVNSHSEEYMMNTSTTPHMSGTNESVLSIDWLKPVNMAILKEADSVDLSSFDEDGNIIVEMVQTDDGETLPTSVAPISPSVPAMSATKAAKKAVQAEKRRNTWKDLVRHMAKRIGRNDCPEYGMY